MFFFSFFFVQGINDLVTPFMAVFISEHFPGSAALETEVRAWLGPLPPRLCILPGPFPAARTTCTRAQRLAGSPVVAQKALIVNQGLPREQGLRVPGVAHAAVPQHGGRQG